LTGPTTRIARALCRSDFSEGYTPLDQPPLEPGSDVLRRLVLDREAGP
jgi:hypothetical protein